MTADQLEESLFADLPGERRVAAPPQLISPLELALRVNLALTQGLIYRASSVTIEAEGQARALVRHAKLRGLICMVDESGKSGVPQLQISGPLALFRRTLLYGRALGELIPLLSWSRHFRLQATCLLDGARLRLALSSGDPIFPSLEPRRFDSRLEERFAHDFARLARDWDVIREPEPVRAGNAIIFPDFALCHRAQSGRRWLLEILGFWTPEYLDRKLAQYRLAGLPNLILCIDEQRDCAAGDLPVGAHVVRYRRRINAASVYDLIAKIEPPAGTSPGCR
jgi:predicted nuclease of restriction endonuclease-like RecB superfamily